MANKWKVVLFGKCMEASSGFRDLASFWLKHSLFTRKVDASDEEYEQQYFIWIPHSINDG